MYCLLDFSINRALSSWANSLLPTIYLQWQNRWPLAVSDSSIMRELHPKEPSVSAHAVGCWSNIFRELADFCAAEQALHSPPTPPAQPVTWFIFVLVLFSAAMSQRRAAREASRLSFAPFPVEKPSGCRSPRSKHNSHALAVKTCRVSAGSSTTACLCCTPHNPWSGRW